MDPDSAQSREIWASAPPMHHARAAHAVVATSDAIYALAGTGDGGPVLAVERFDGTSWSDEAELPGKGLNAPAAVFLDGRIYVIGGFGTVTNRPTSKVLMFTMKTKQWGLATDLPAPRGGHAAVVMNNMIHVVGGGNSRSTIADHSVFDPATNRWSRRASLPRALGSPAAVVFGEKLYAIGGRSGSRDFGDVFVYDPSTDSWSTGPSIEPRGTSGAVVFQESIYLIGGESQAKSKVLADVLRLSAGSSAWQQAPPMPTARSFARAVLFHGAVYVVGGSPRPQTSHAPRGLAVVERLQRP
jgi:N-acetylneuraminic acid mutarotase